MGYNVGDNVGDLLGDRVGFSVGESCECKRMIEHVSIIYMA